ncbi:MAG: 50S ribosomal protein L3 [SAR202 cluster bacterium]|nr:50S ribosomal protein L3 [SAR202 cluster bacterium]
MLQGYLGKKVGMTQVFREDGNVVPVTVVQAGPCSVTQIKTKEKDGYEAVQVGFDTLKKPNKPMSGHFKASQPSRHVREFKAADLSQLQVGQRIGVGIFTPGELVDVIARTKGRGFSGGMKRHGFHGGPRTHGQSDRARAPGSIGANTFPGRIMKGLRMAGHYGDEQVTVKNLEVVRVDPERNLLLLKGAVPGAPNGLLTIRRTGKSARVAG